MSFRAIYTDKYGNQKLIKLPWYAALQGSPSRAERAEAVSTRVVVVLQAVSNQR